MNKNENVIKLAYMTIESRTPKSAWDKGVKDYALGLLEDLEEFTTLEELEKNLLNGAKDWATYSWGGCSLIYDEDIAKALCTPSELKKTRNGQLKPNKREEWLDTQARALYQAYRLIERTFKNIEKGATKHD